MAKAKSGLNHLGFQYQTQVLRTKRSAIVLNIRSGQVNVKVGTAVSQQSLRRFLQKQQPKILQFLKLYQKYQGLNLVHPDPFVLIAEKKYPIVYQADQVVAFMLSDQTCRLNQNLISETFVSDHQQGFYLLASSYFYAQ